MIEPLTAAVLATHETAGDGNLAVVLVFVGIVATAGWLLLARLQWRLRVVVAAAAWIVGVALAVVF